ncbi:hypothetical protein RDI58_016449 [Solanum bulbocastanum]|uniref:Cysteine proteinase inhibitor n=1 Tax=Solanum bulbocastanum TaxID=147425 RepID=A0AAN8TJQ3_SOLBU
MMYYLTLAATDAGNKKEYEAKIWVKECEHYKKVIDFKLVGDNSAKIGGIINVLLPNNLEFQDLARFVVQKYNKNQEDFKKVVEFKLVGDDSAKPGGIINVPFPNSPEFQDLARFVVQDYNKKEEQVVAGMMYYITLVATDDAGKRLILEFVEVLNVKEQVVAGMMYYITLSTTDAGKKKIYEAKIWVKEWEDFEKVVEFKLVGDDSAKPGGIIIVPIPNSPEFQNLVRFAVQDYNKKENAHLEFVEVLNVKEQVDAGMMYYITLVATDVGYIKIYETKIWVKEWENFKEVQEFKQTVYATK